MRCKLSAEVVGVPTTLERKAIQRHFNGHIFCGEGISQYPSNRANVTLSKNGQKIANTLTSAVGSYELKSPIESGASYKIIVKARCGKASRTLDEKETIGLPRADFNIYRRHQLRNS